MHGNVPHMFDCWADPVVHLLLLKSYIIGRYWLQHTELEKLHLLMCKRRSVRHSKVVQYCIMTKVFFLVELCWVVATWWSNRERSWWCRNRTCRRCPPWGSRTIWQSGRSRIMVGMENNLKAAIILLRVYNILNLKHWTVNCCVTLSSTIKLVAKQCVQKLVLW